MKKSSLLVTMSSQHPQLERLANVRSVNVRQVSKRS